MRTQRHRSEQHPRPYREDEAETGSESSHCGSCDHAMPNPLCKGTFKGFLGCRQHSECIVEDGTHWPQVTLEPLNYGRGGERLLWCAKGRNPPRTQHCLSQALNHSQTTSSNHELGELDLAPVGRSSSGLETRKPV